MCLIGQHSNPLLTKLGAGEKIVGRNYSDRGVTRLDRIKNEYIRGSLGIRDIAEKIVHDS